MVTVKWLHLIQYQYQWFTPFGQGKLLPVRTRPTTFTSYKRKLVVNVITSVNFNPQVCNFGWPLFVFILVNRHCHESIGIYVVGLLVEFRRTVDASDVARIVWLGVPTTMKNTLLFMWAGFLTITHSGSLVSSYSVECVFGAITELEYE